MHLLATTLLLTTVVTTQAGTLTFAAPSTWKARPATSSMRIAEFVVPKAPEDPEDAELIVYFFGGGGGSVEANIQRWVGQFKQPSGAAKDAGRATFNVGTLKVTTVDVRGTYVAELRPGAAARHNKPNFRMRAAVIGTPKGPYFVKFTGPAATVQQASAAFDQFLKSLRFQ